MRTIEQRFWSKVSLPDENDCMLWTGTILRNGYGQINIRAKLVYVHRFSLILADGMPESSNMEAAHAPVICHNRACVAPIHLRWATKADNEADKLLDGTRVYGEKHGISKLTESDVIEIRSLYSQNLYTQSKLGELYSVDQRTISRIVRYEQWAEVQ